MQRDRELLVWCFQPWKSYSDQQHDKSPLKLKRLQQQILREQVEFVNLRRYVDLAKGKVEFPDTVDANGSSSNAKGMFSSDIFGELDTFLCTSCQKSQSLLQPCKFCGHNEVQSWASGDSFGYIELAEPVVHPWFFHVICQFFDEQKLRQILCYDICFAQSSHVSLEDTLPFMEYSGTHEEFVEVSGARAIRKLLQNLSPDTLRKSTPAIFGSYTNFDFLFFDIIPVVPTRFRPLTHVFENGMCKSAYMGGLNNLYRRVINRNNRLRRLKELKAPLVITKNEMRMLQDAVEDLFVNTKDLSYNVVSEKRRMESFVDIIAHDAKLSNDIGVALGVV